LQRGLSHHRGVARVDGSAMHRGVQPQDLRGSCPFQRL
jgi:hypothetical protein